MAGGGGEICCEGSGTLGTAVDIRATWHPKVRVSLGWGEGGVWNVSLPNQTIFFFQDLPLMVSGKFFSSGSFSCCTSSSYVSTISFPSSECTISLPLLVIFSCLSSSYIDFLIFSSHLILTCFLQYSIPPLYPSSVWGLKLGTEISIVRGI